MKKVITKKRISVIILFLMFLALSNFQLLAQKAPPELTVHASGAISTYCFQPTVKGSSIGYNSDLGVGFTGFFNRQLGINVGAGFGLFNVKSKATTLNTITPGLFDNANGLAYDLYTTLSGYTEIHKSLYINIPVMLLFQTKQTQYLSWKQAQRASFYTMGGLKMLFLFNNKYEAGVESISTAAYYTELKNWAATQAFAGLGYFDAGYNSSDKMDFGIMIAVAVELGVKWRIDNSLSIYTGAFFECGLNDPIKDNRKPYENYIYEDNLKNDLIIMKFADRANLMTVGIKLRFAFSKRQRSYY